MEQFGHDCEASRSAVAQERHPVLDVGPKDPVSEAAHIGAVDDDLARRSDHRATIGM
jgi:hypothetical protein